MGMRRNLFDSLCVRIFALSQPISGIFTERCHHQQFLQVLADTKNCLASAEQFEGMCGVVEGRQRCLEERLSPCLTPSLTGKLIGEYRSIWRWEFEEQYSQAADDERVAQFLDSCRTLLGVQADRNHLILEYPSPSKEPQRVFRVALLISCPKKKWSCLPTTNLTIKHLMHGLVGLFCLESPHPNPGRCLFGQRMWLPGAVSGAIGFEKLL